MDKGVHCNKVTLNWQKMRNYQSLSHKGIIPQLMEHLYYEMQ